MYKALSSVVQSSVAVERVYCRAGDEAARMTEGGYTKQRYKKKLVMAEVIVGVDVQQVK